MPHDNISHEAIAEAWDFWLAQHPISVQESIETAINHAVLAWLETHTDELLERIAAKVAAGNLT